MGQSATKSCVVAWGSNEFKQLGIVSDKQMCAPSIIDSLNNIHVKSITAGGNHSAAISQNGDLYTWGQGVNGQLGHGDRMDVHLPKLVRFLQGKKITMVSCSLYHSMGVTDNGQLYTWGSTNCGALGHGRLEDHSVSPKLVQALTPYHVLRVAAGDYHCLCTAIPPKTGVEDENGLTNSSMSDGSLGTLVFSWGGGVLGKLGHGNFEDETMPKELTIFRGLDVRQVACSTYTSAAVTHSGILFTWGGGSHGKLGVGSSPLADSIAKFNRQLASERLTGDGENEIEAPNNTSPHRQVGGTASRPVSPSVSLCLSIPFSVPFFVDKNLIVSQVSLASQHAAAVTSDGSLYSWGLSGRLGHDEPKSELDENEPRKVEALGNVRITSCACGPSHTLAVDESGEVYSWGVNKYLSHACSIPPAYLPTNVRALKNRGVVNVAAGIAHSLALVDSERAGKVILNSVMRLLQGSESTHAVASALLDVNGKPVGNLDTRANFPAREATNFDTNEAILPQIPAQPDRDWLPPPNQTLKVHLGDVSLPLPPLGAPGRNNESSNNHAEAMIIMLSRKLLDAEQRVKELEAEIENLKKNRNN